MNRWQIQLKSVSRQWIYRYHWGFGIIFFTLFFECFQIIYKDFKLNIPHQLLDNLEYTLNNSNNIRNRANKKIKIGYSTSEDAVTWIFVKYFIQTQKIDILRKILCFKSKINEILIWGVPQINKEYTSPLKNICKEFDGISSAYAMQSGREVRVMVVPEKISDLQAYQMARDIKEKIEQKILLKRLTVPKLEMEIDKKKSWYATLIYILP